MNEESFSHMVLFTSYGPKQKYPVEGILNTDQTTDSGLDPDQKSFLVWIPPKSPCEFMEYTNRNYE